jgi:hypothetical protein
MGDWLIASDGTQVLQQNGATSSTPRAMYASGASGAPWTGATSISARVKLIAAGNGNPAATICLRYTNTSNFYCAALLQNGVQIQTAVGGSGADSATWSSTVAVGTFYDLKLSVDAGGALAASLGGNQLGTFTPAALASGYAALGTESMRASFDNVVVTRP